MNKNCYTDSGWLLLPLLLFIIIRTAIIWLLFHLTGGREFTMDLWVFESGLDPLSVITFSANANAFSQPPLFPVILAPFAFLTSLLFNQFLAARISFTIFELIGFLIIAQYLYGKKDIPLNARKTALVILSISPIGFMAGAVMRTEEAVVMIFTSALILAMHKNRVRAAAIIIFLGTITGKFLFVVMFFPLLLVSKDIKTVFRWGIMPTLFFFALYCIIGHLIKGTIPIIGFSPESTTFCLSIFSLAQHYMDLTGNFMKWVSSGLVLTAYLTFWKYRRKIDTTDFPASALYSFIILFLFFYHITPEYLIFALPLLAILPIGFFNSGKRWLFNGLHMILALTSTGFGITYGLRIYSRGFGYKSPSKDMALKTYRFIFDNFPLEFLEQFLLVLSIISLIAMLLITIRHLNRKPV